MRSLAALAFLLIGCTGDILPIQLPGRRLVVEAGRISGAMHEVRAGFEGPIAVGGGTDPALLERRDGGWIPLAAPSDWRGPILDVAVGQGQLVIAGRGGRVAVGDRDQLQAVATSEEGALRSIFSRAADDVFIAGEGALLHWNGESIARIDTSSVAPAPDLFAVWGTGTSLFAAGAGGVVLSVAGESVQLAETGTVATLRSLHGRSRTDLYVAGGDERGVMLHWDGQTWTDLALPFMPPLQAVYAGRSGVWVTGDAGYLARWDGERWAEIGTGVSVALTGAFELDGDLFMTGGNVDDPAASGFIARYGE